MSCSGFPKVGYFTTSSKTLTGNEVMLFAQNSICEVWGMCKQTLEPKQRPQSQMRARKKVGKDTKKEACLDNPRPQGVEDDKQMFQSKNVRHALTAHGEKKQSRSLVLGSEGTQQNEGLLCILSQ
jgi:hypothetical protein